MEREHRLNARSRVFSHVSVSVLAAIACLALLQVSLDGLRGTLLDAVYRTQWWTRPHPEISLIAYDDRSASFYGGTTKVPVEELAFVLEHLAADAPRVVGILGPINDHGYTTTELETLAGTFSKLPHVFIGYTDDDALGLSAPAALGTHVSYLPGFISRDTFSYGADSVSRRVMLTIDAIPSVYLRMACFPGTASDPRCQPQRYRHERVGESLQTYINWQGPAGTYPMVSTRAFRDGRVAKGTYTGKTVLIASALNAKRGADHIFTPFSRRPFETTALEGAANGLASLMRDNGLTKSPGWLNWVLSFVVALLTVNLVMVLSPGKGILLVLAQVVGLFAAGWVSLFGFSMWLDTAHPLILAGISYYLVIPYRLVDEYRKRWHYQEKSELMYQLEQLKSNFLSLVSHDLKTPVARIQGNAELLLSAPAGLDEKQRQSLEAIIHTTEDLSQYVETVLDLTRIESSQMPLHKTSKDVNAIIQEVVESRKFAAREKNIHIETKLEPLFSIKFDVRLIRRVLSNIVENAIKYSPPNSRVTLSSKEEGDWIRISVTDEGIGIPTEEQEKIFEKFYRCENSTTQDVKGTGLGLYLAKYFVELHRGLVDLSSESGKGSTFTVSLPV